MSASDHVVDDLFESIGSTWDADVTLSGLASLYQETPDETVPYVTMHQIGASNRVSHVGHKTRIQFSIWSTSEETRASITKALTDVFDDAILTLSGTRWAFPATQDGIETGIEMEEDVAWYFRHIDYIFETREF